MSLISCQRYRKCYLFLAHHWVLLFCIRKPLHNRQVHAKVPSARKKEWWTKPNSWGTRQNCRFQRLFAFLRHNDKSSIGHPLAYNEQPTFFLTKAKRGTQGLFKHFPLCLSSRQNDCCEKSKVPQVKINWWIVHWSLFEVHCGYIPQPGNTRMALLFAAQLIHNIGKWSLILLYAR